MTKMPLSVKNQSIETSGLTKDYREALCEYIWNGFEAGATEVTISYSLNELEGVQDITISDNGSGINYYELSDTFGSFLVSQKNSLSLKEKAKANKGKGRFSFGIFSTLAEWHTVFSDEGRNKKYTIVLSNANKQEFDYSDLEDADEALTGTKVVFYNITGISSDDLSFDALGECLLKQFSWFLYLHKHQDYKIILNGEPLDYKEHINVDLSVSKTQNIDGNDFEIDLIVWNQRINEKYSCYLMDSNCSLKNIDTTTFNRNTVGFSHSVFVKSKFIDNCSRVSLDDSDQLIVGNPQEYDAVIRKLRKVIQELIGQQIRAYMSGKADEEIRKMIEEKKTFPVFSDDEYGQLRKRDLIRVTKEIYCAEPKIFYKLSEVQEKSLLAFLNLLLVSEERENVLNIIEQIVDLSTEERANFAGILKKTKLENVIETIKFIDSRYQVIEILKRLIYDLTAFTTERSHIQEIIEKHFWLFGEQYNLASADVNMQRALEGYLNILYGANAPDAQLAPDEEENRRMDIFLCHSRRVEGASGSMMDENIIVELKAPKVSLTHKVYRQIDDYMRYVRRQPQFSSTLRRWKFIAVCREVDDEVKAMYKTFESHNKHGLVSIYENFEIYALSWDDVFKSFDLRHSFMLDKLKLSRDELTRDLEIEEPNRETVDKLTQKVVSL